MHTSAFRKLLVALLAVALLIGVTLAEANGIMPKLANGFSARDEADTGNESSSEAPTGDDGSSTGGTTGDGSSESTGGTTGDGTSESTGGTTGDDSSESTGESSSETPEPQKLTVTVTFVDMDGTQIGATSGSVDKGEEYTISGVPEGYQFFQRTVQGSSALSTNPTFKVRENYSVKVYCQKLLTITADKKETEYDGTEHTYSVSDVTCTGLKDGHTLSSIGFDYSVYNLKKAREEAITVTPKSAVIGGAGSNYYLITYAPGSMTISKRRVTVTVTGEQVEADYDGKEHKATFSLSTTDELYKVSNVEPKAGSKTVTRTDVGEDELKLTAEDFSNKNENFDVTFSIDSLPKVTVKALEVRVVPDDNQEKRFGAADPKKLTFKVLDKDNTDVTSKFADQYTVELERAEGEMPKTYAITAKVCESGTGNLKLTFNSTKVFTITNQLSNHVKLTVPTDVTTRTKTVMVTISAPVDLSDCNVVLKLDNSNASGGADQASLEGGSFTFTITDKTEQVSGADYKHWLTVGSHALSMTADGTAIQASLPKVSVAKANVSISGTIVPSTSKYDGYFTSKPDSFQSLVVTLPDGEVEAIKLTVDVPDGEFYCSSNNPSAIYGDITTAIYKADAEHNDNYSNREINFAAVIVSPDVVASGSITAKAILDAYAGSITVESGALDFRGGGNMEISLSDKNIVSVTTSVGGKGGAFAQDSSSKNWVYSGGSVDYDSLPGIGSGIVITATDDVGNTSTITVNAGPAGTTTRIKITDIKPGEETEIGDIGDDEGYVISKTPRLWLKGTAQAGEKIVITLRNANGDQIVVDTAITATGSGEWRNGDTATWQAWLPDKNNDVDFDWPEGELLTLSFTYTSGMSGPTTKVYLLYDKVLQPVRILTPMVNGSKIIAGYAEPLSSVQFENANGEFIEAQANAYGFFCAKTEWPYEVDENGDYKENEDGEYIYMPGFITGYSYSDFAGNEEVYDLTFSADANLVLPAFSQGSTFVQDSTAMACFPATYVSMEELTEGPVVLPLLVANCFKVGELTIALEDGKVTFNAVIFDDNQADGAVPVLKIFGDEPAAEDYDPENPAGEADATVFTPAEGAEGLWFVYQINATVTEDQYTLEEEPVDIADALRAE